jgi:hypothetical protein
MFDSEWGDTSSVLYLFAKGESISLAGMVLEDAETCG